MAYISRFTKTINVTASGGAAQSVDMALANGGWLEAVVVKNGTSGISTGANLLITQGGRTLFTATTTGSTNSTVTYQPRVQTHNALAGNTPLGLTSAVSPPPYVDKVAIAGQSSFPGGSSSPINIQVSCATAGAVPAAASAGVPKNITIDLYISGN